MRASGEEQQEGKKEEEEDPAGGGEGELSEKQEGEGFWGGSFHALYKYKITVYHFVSAFLLAVALTLRSDMIRLFGLYFSRHPQLSTLYVVTNFSLSLYV